MPGRLSSSAWVAVLRLTSGAARGRGGRCRRRDSRDRSAADHDLLPVDQQPGLVERAQVGAAERPAGGTQRVNHPVAQLQHDDARAAHPARDVDDHLARGGRTRRGTGRSQPRHRADRRCHRPRSRDRHAPAGPDHPPRGQQHPTGHDQREDGQVHRPQREPLGQPPARRRRRRRRSGSMPARQRQHRSDRLELDRVALLEPALGDTRSHLGQLGAQQLQASQGRLGRGRARGHAANLGSRPHRTNAQMSACGERLRAAARRRPRPCPARRAHRALRRARRR